MGLMDSFPVRTEETDLILSRAGTAGQQPKPPDDVREAFFTGRLRIGSLDDVVDEALSKAFSCKLVTDFLFWLQADVAGGCD